MGVLLWVYAVLTACGKTHAAQFSRWGLGRRCIPPEPLRFAPFFVAFRLKYTRASSPGGGSSLTRLVSRAPRPHRENWPLSALTRVSPQAVSASLRSGEVGSEWARNPPIRAVPWRETGSSRRLPLPVAHLASAEVAPAAFGAETGCLNGLLEDPPTESGAGAGVSAVPLFRSLPWKGTFVFRVFGSIPCEPGGRHFQHFSENGPLFAQAADLLPGVLDLHL